jgi:hypothetical protein
VSHFVPRPLATQFIITDGSRARWVSRSEAADDFITVKALAAEPAPHDEPPSGMAFDSSTGRPSTVGGAQRGGANQVARRHRLQFMEQVTDAINAEVAQGDVARLAIVAPTRMLAEICQRLSIEARAKLAKTLARDLTKTPDHRLTAWLSPMEMD